LSQELQLAKPPLLIRAQLSKVRRIELFPKDLQAVLNSFDLQNKEE